MTTSSSHRTKPLSLPLCAVLGLALVGCAGGRATGGHVSADGGQLHWDDEDATVAPPTSHDGAITPPPPPPAGCGFSCNADLLSGSTSCTKRVARLASSGPRALFRVDLGGCKELRLKVRVCDPSGWVLNVGNSSTNNGGGGDKSTSSNDSELQIVDGKLSVFGNDQGLVAGYKTLLTDAAFAKTSGCSELAFNISDGKLSTSAPKHELTSSYLFRINQPDSQGAPDALLYVGLNRVVDSLARQGLGAENATFEIR